MGAYVLPQKMLTALDLTNTNKKKVNLILFNYNGTM